MVDLDLNPSRRRLPVAVLVSAAEYARLAAPQASFAAALDAFREAVDARALHGDDAFADVRDESPDRDAAI